MTQENRIDPSIPIEDEQDGQAFFDALVCLPSLEIYDQIEHLDYSTAAAIWRAIRNANHDT